MRSDVQSRCPTLRRHYRPEPGEAVGAAAAATERRDTFARERHRALWLKRMIRGDLNVVEVIGAVDDDEHQMPALVFEFCNNSDLARVLGVLLNPKGKRAYLDAQTALQMARDAAKGLAALHEMNIVHRDISLRNIFIHRASDGSFSFKIGDFGLCCDLDNADAPDAIVPRGFKVAPDAQTTLASDVYALGVAVYQLFAVVDLSHCYTSDQTTFASQLALVDEDLKSVRERNGEAANIIAQMLSTNPSARPTAKQAARAFSSLLKQALCDLIVS